MLTPENQQTTDGTTGQPVVPVNITITNIRAKLENGGSTLEVMFHNEEPNKKLQGHRGENWGDLEAQVPYRSLKEAVVENFKKDGLLIFPSAVVTNTTWRLLNLAGIACKGTAGKIIANTSWQIGIPIFVLCAVTHVVPQIKSLASERNLSFADASALYFKDEYWKTSLILGFKFWANAMGWTVFYEGMKALVGSANTLGAMLARAISAGIGSSLSLFATAEFVEIVIALQNVCGLDGCFKDKNIQRPTDTETLGTKLLNNLALLPKSFLEGFIFSILADLNLSEDFKKLATVEKESPFATQFNDISSKITDSLIVGTISSTGFLAGGVVISSPVEYGVQNCSPKVSSLPNCTFFRSCCNEEKPHKGKNIKMQGDDTVSTITDHEDNTRSWWPPNCCNRPGEYEEV